MQMTLGLALIIGGWLLTGLPSYIHFFTKEYDLTNSGLDLFNMFVAILGGPASLFASWIIWGDHFDGTEILIKKRK